MSAPNVHFCDLRRVRAGAQRLATDGESPPAAEGYVTFAAAPAQARPATMPPLHELEKSSPQGLAWGNEQGLEDRSEHSALPAPPPLPPLPPPSANVAFSTLPASREEVSLPPTPAAATFGEAGWDAMLSRVLRAAPASAAFVTNEQGLIVATAGEIALEESESAGSLLLVALEQVARLSSPAAPADLVTFSFREEWLNGLRVKEKPEFTLGLVTAAPVDRAAAERALRVFLT